MAFPRRVVFEQMVVEKIGVQIDGKVESLNAFCVMRKDAKHVGPLPCLGRKGTMADTDTQMKAPDCIPIPRRHSPVEKLEALRFAYVKRECVGVVSDNVCLVVYLAAALQKATLQHSTHIAPVMSIERRRIIPGCIRAIESHLDVFLRCWLVAQVMRKDTTSAGSATMIFRVDVERLTSTDKLVDAKLQLWRQLKQERRCVLLGAIRFQYVDCGTEVCATYIAW